MGLELGGRWVGTEEGESEGNNDGNNDGDNDGCDDDDILVGAAEGGVVSATEGARERLNEGDAVFTGVGETVGVVLLRTCKLRRRILDDNEDDDDDDDDG